MAEFKVITYEKARSDFLKAEMEKAQNRMKFWQTKIKKAKNAIAEMEAHDNASNAGWEYNFYKDALEALEDNKFRYESGFVAGFAAAQPKWISVEERLPEEKMAVLVYGQRRVFNGKRIETFPMVHVAFLDEGWFAWDSEDVIEVTHWMPLPSTEGRD